MPPLGPNITPYIPLYKVKVFFILSTTTHVPELMRSGETSSASNLSKWKSGKWAA